MSDDEDFMQDSDQEGYVTFYLGWIYLIDNLGTTLNTRKTMMKKVEMSILKTNTTTRSR
jgi:hypothetical protein